MTGSKRSKRARSYITGEKGCNRVRLYPHARDGTLMLENHDDSGKRRNLSLHHADVDRGKQAAEELARRSERMRVLAASS